ncbi:hypothetical protein ACQ4PT_015243 [Festuca glaucescens]
MAAVVRSGARRLAGSALLQRAPGVDRPFLARFTSSSAKKVNKRPKPTLFFVSGSASCSRSIRYPRSFSHLCTYVQPDDEILAKKEELYDLIALTGRHLYTYTDNRLLLKYLSAQIKPRPHDPKWRVVRAQKRSSAVYRPLGIVTGFCMGVFAILLMRAIGAIRVQEEMALALMREQLQQEVDAAEEEDEEEVLD